jgi:hypothetical protein
MVLYSHLVFVDGGETPLRGIAIRFEEMPLEKGVDLGR